MPPATADFKYDVILFGATGFTGKLALEYILSRYNDKIAWAISARDEKKARRVLTQIASYVSKEAGEIVGALPEILQADLVCANENDVGALRQVVRRSRLVLSTAGPFQLYGKTLVSLCAELGVHYCDITGETNFVRDTIVKSGAAARSSGAVVVHHCGNDCIPSDLLTYEINQFCKQTLGDDACLQQITFLNEVSDATGLSGGTTATALYNLSSSSDAKSISPDLAFDPLLSGEEGARSEYLTKNVTPSSTVRTELGSASPWIMGPVMVNCIRRSNALLRYSKNLDCSDLLLNSKSWSSWLRSTVLAAAIVVPPLRALLPAPGEGPSREQLEQGYLTLHAQAIVYWPVDGIKASVDRSNEGRTSRKVQGTFHFGKDTGYLYTAAMLVETGILLLERTAGVNRLQGGVWTPASSLGHDLTVRLLDRLEAKMDIRFEEDGVTEFIGSRLSNV